MNDSIRKNGTDLTEVLGDLDGSVFAQKIERALSDVALGVVTYGDKGKTGKVSVTFNMKRIGESNQVELTHEIAYEQPTSRGKRTEVDRTATPMHVGRGGKLTLMPEVSQQMDAFSSRERDFPRATRES